MKEIEDWSSAINKADKTGLYNNFIVRIPAEQVSPEPRTEIVSGVSCCSKYSSEWPSARSAV